jgi:hypothetical protein
LVFFLGCFPFFSFFIVFLDFLSCILGDHIRVTFVSVSVQCLSKLNRPVRNVSRPMTLTPLQIPRLNTRNTQIRNVLSRVHVE